MTSRQLVLDTLNFRNTTGIVPRQLWDLPWAGQNYPDQLLHIRETYPADIGGPETTYAKASSIAAGQPYEIGDYVDEWGCQFTSLQRGIVGEAKRPIVPAEDEDWEDTSRIHLPEEQLSFDRAAVNAYCAKTDRFMMAHACPNPFERLQYIRGTENLYVDLITQPKGLLDFMERMQEFYARQMTAWAETDVDALNFMDDWGAQRDLLISPDLWDQLFRPMYQQFIDIAHSHGKKIFMHSDGNILRILPKLIDMGLDAVNSQLFCMGLENLKPFRGKITFWGEIDRQHILPYGTTEDVRAAVREVRETLWQDGGCIAQCEFGIGAKPENVEAVFRTWEELGPRR